MAKLSFTSQIASWVDKVQGAAEAVFKESAQAIVEEMQRPGPSKSNPAGEGGHMRIDTGFLRNSLMASTASMPAIVPGNGPAPNTTYNFDFGEIEAVIAGSELGDTLYFGYTAGYAAHREYGANGQPGDGFVRLAAQLWPSTVDRVTAELKSRLGL